MIDMVKRMFKRQFIVQESIYLHLRRGEIFILKFRWQTFCFKMEAGRAGE